ncbi:hypothetical protein [Streptomyces sp. NPDC059247]|uniref:hypothetical protein n=1 Tax=Streptomyces sp. NPDC059247 TaxID=3346790 RepID=UPI00368223EB
MSLRVASKSSAMRPGGPDAAPPALVLALTDQDNNLVVLPERGNGAHLFAVIEHTVWHPGTAAVHTVGLAPSDNERLITTVESLLQSTARTTPWEQLTGLVRSHPADPSRIYC